MDEKKDEVGRKQQTDELKNTIVKNKASKIFRISTLLAFLELFFKSKTEFITMMKAKHKKISKRFYQMKN